MTPERAAAVAKYNASSKARAAQRRYRHQAGVSARFNLRRSIKRLTARISEKEALVARIVAEYPALEDLSRG